MICSFSLHDKTEFLFIVSWLRHNLIWSDSFTRPTSFGNCIWKMPNRKRFYSIKLIFLYHIRKGRGYIIFLFLFSLLFWFRILFTFHHVLLSLRTVLDWNRRDLFNCLACQVCHFIFFKIRSKIANKFGILLFVPSMIISQVLNKAGMKSKTKPTGTRINDFWLMEQFVSVFFMIFMNHWKYYTLYIERIISNLYIAHFSLKIIFFAKIKNKGF